MDLSVILGFVSKFGDLRKQTLVSWDPRAPLRGLEDDITNKLHSKMEQLTCAKTPHPHMAA